MRLLDFLATGLSATLFFGSVSGQSTVPAWGQCGGNGWGGGTACSFLPSVHPGIQHSDDRFCQALFNFNRVCCNRHQQPHNLSCIDNSRWYWIRAVASPNFHSYLQAKPTNTPSKAYLESPSGAGQFKIEAGQLVHLTEASSLYLNVENPTDKTKRKLETWFSGSKNSYGTFAFQGDTLTWNTPDINRPNLAAWLVCENQEVFINTGAYLYQTPAGCFDQTIFEVVDGFRDGYSTPLSHYSR
ncbi:hypothetical protein CTA2_5933 [Colletotrichum tanaceti]|uniref:Uncharacterized protein n=1 Tax=Colletotrichum tanaceti TaxID=1306861 RepID=A0A4U6XGT0_9PEZI|nr:hypothetical protein CTA2_5933 [Colletotrichum tanaceti]TKW55100.1 hypothetical protein CTA1_6974 [Colletotrichum tanaceti]